MTAQGTPPPVECSDHWHCDPDLAAHKCWEVDRAVPCPACGQDPAPTVGEKCQHGHVKASCRVCTVPPTSNRYDPPVSAPPADRAVEAVAEWRQEQEGD